MIWDDRYSSSEFFYGTEPNDFLRDQHVFIPAGGRVLCLAEGEGRNAVWLAQQGFQVTAVDQSSVGLAKARVLAARKAVNIDIVTADLAAWPMGTARWDGVVSIWCHLPSAVRRKVHRHAVAGLRPGGVLVLEAYTPAQLTFKTGGPSDADLMPTLALLRDELAGLDFKIARECERSIHEGVGHRGRSAVVQVVARLPD
jgi:SAM-dependent methyltransferase